MWGALNQPWGASMSFAIMQSKKRPRTYLFLPRRDDVSAVPPALMDDVGEMKYLRTAHAAQDETAAMARHYAAIVDGIAAKGYHVISWPADTSDFDS